MSARRQDAHLPVRHALILAAGRGARLGEHTKLVPKPLLPLGAGTLLGRQLDQLEAHGVQRVTLIVGYRGDRIRSAVGKRRGALEVDFVRNPEWASSGSAWSLVRAAAALRGGEPVLLLHGDLAFDDALLARVLAEGQTATAVDRAWLPMTGDEVVAWTKDGALAGLRKGALDAESENVGEFVGISRLEPAFAWAFVDYCVARTATDRTLDYEQPLLSEFVALGKESCRPVFVHGDFWRNVNYAEDLRDAEDRFGRRSADGGTGA